MTKTRIIKSEENKDTIDMGSLKPGQIGIITDTNSERYNGLWVRRTYNDRYFCVEGIATGDDCYWLEINRLQVRPLAKGEKLMIEFEGDDDE